MALLDSSIDNLTRRKKDLANYDYIIRQIRQTDISADDSFQRKFTYFYKIRRKAEWRKAYYELFEENKYNSDVSFEMILRSIYHQTGQIEASFASKMFAALNPERPIWDSIVLSKLRIKPSRNPDKQKRLQDTVEIYDLIVGWYERFLQSDEAKEFIQKFDSAFPDYVGFSEVKKIDFLIWGSGDSDPFAS